MAAGDISDALLVTLRTKINESSAGFWTDAQLFDLLSSSQREIIKLMLMKQQNAQRLDPYYEYPPIRSATKVGTISTSSAVTYAMTSLTDILQVLRIELYNSSPVRHLGTTLLPYVKFVEQMDNTYTGHSYNTTTKTGDVYTAIAGTTLYTSFTTFPNTDYGTINVYYVYNPPAMTTSVDPIVTADCYDSMIYMALSKALIKDNRPQEASMYYQNAVNLI